MKLIGAITIAMILLFTLVAKSQETNCYYIIDSFIDSLQIGENESFEGLAKKIIKPEWNECEKVRAVFYWIAKNIQYDYEGQKTGYWQFYPSDIKIACETYNQGKGVCSGYSHLFKLMCNEIGVESEVVVGYSRIEMYQAGLPIEELNHSWNVVKINDEWKLIDVTWANSTKLGNTINDFYFLTPPEEFIANHLPENDEWQLLKSPISKDEFDAYPYISSDYFKLGYDKNFPKKGLLTSNDGASEFIIGLNDNYELIVDVYDYQSNERKKTNFIMVEKCAIHTVIKIELETQGQYLVKVSTLGNEKSSFVINDGILYYTLIYEE